MVYSNPSIPRQFNLLPPRLPGGFCPGPESRQDPAEPASQKPHHEFRGPGEPPAGGKRRRGPNLKHQVGVAVYPTDRIPFGEGRDRFHTGAEPFE